ncbi:MAG: hypothetical protein ACOX6T_13035 [Myxococcales bacterium]|jgi:hypothetical protein
MTNRSTASSSTRWAGARGPRLVLLGALVAALLAPALASASTLREPVSGEQFEMVRTEGGTRFRCIGVGAHKIFTFKVYAVAYCVDERLAGQSLGDYARTHFPDKRGRPLVEALQDDPGFFEMLASLPGDKMMVVRFLRDIPGDRLAGSFRESLKKLVPGEDAERVAQAIGARSVAEGETALLYSQGADLVMQLGGTQRVLSDVPLVTERLWRVWLGKGTPTPNLKRSLAIEAARQR